MLLACIIRQSALMHNFPGQLRVQAGGRVQGLLSGRGENCLGEEVA